MATKVLFHNACVDGFCSAWIASKVFRDQAEYIAVNYSEPPPPINKDDTIYILDFSYKKEVLQAMIETVGENKLILLDHHTTAEAELRDFGPNIQFDMKRSGARMTFDYFNRHLTKTFGYGLMETIVSYVQDRDLWTFRLPNSREINLAIQSYPFDFVVWDQFLRLAFWSALEVEGRAIKRYQDQLLERIINNQFEVELVGHKVPCVNTCCLQSEVGEILVNEPDKKPDFAIIFYQKKPGEFNYSLRSRADNSGVDVAQIAKTLGGGGHRCAAGFRLPGPITEYGTTKCP